MKPFLRWCFVATALTLAGCSNTSWRKSEVLAVPLQPTLQQEVILARMEQILASRALTDDERAQLLYERGVLYDSLGLRALARNDFSQALAIRPDMPEVFNYLAHTYTLKYQYLLGRDILVAPVHEEGRSDWTLYLPEDNWVHAWTGEAFRGGEVTVNAPIGKPPVFYRADSEWAALFASLKSI